MNTNECPQSDWPQAKDLGDSADSHFSEKPGEPIDDTRAHSLAYMIGDTYIDSYNESPYEQWKKIAKALRIHGFKLVRDKK